MSLFAPSVDGASHEHAKEHDNDLEDGTGSDDDDDETSTAGGGSFEGVVMVEAPSPTLSEEDEQHQNPGGSSKRSRRDQKKRPVVSRSPYEWLCLDPETAAEDDMRTAYFRLCDLFRSKALDDKSKAVAEAYFVEVQRAFECLLVSKKMGKNLHDESRLDEDDGTSATIDNHDEDLGQEDRRIRREDARFAKLLRRQQQQPWSEVGLQVGPDPLILQGRGTINKPLVALSLSGTSTRSIPAVSSFLEPKLRAVLHAIKTRTAPDPDAGNSDVDDDDDDLELLYCPPTTLHLTQSILTVINSKGSYQFSVVRGMRPVTGQQQQQRLFLIPDSVPEDRPLRWGLRHTFSTLSYNIRLRQEFFLLAQRKRERALVRNKRLRLPDAVVEFETDALIPGTATVRASAALSPSPALRRRGVLLKGKKISNDGKTLNGGIEPLHVEASISLAPGQGSLLAPRLGLAAYRRDSALGGTLFACADSGSWMTGWPERAAAWGRRIRDVSTPWSSLPTVEAGYCFSGDATMLGMQSGRPFTKRAKSGLRRLHDEVDLVGHQHHRQRTPSKSWTVSGAVTTGGVAGYLRYAKHLSPPLPSHPTKRLMHHLARDLHVEAEICAQKTHGSGLFSLEKILSGAWGQTETSHIAVRGLKGVGNSSRFGLEMSINNASSCNNSVVLSLYFSKQIDNGNPSGLSRRAALPILLLQDPSSPLSSSTTNLIYAAAVLPMLGCAAVDLYRSWRKYSARKDGKEDEKDERAKKQKRAKRTRLYRQRRAEADELVTLLAGPVTERQQQQQQQQHGGLVIISAKYGVLAASPTNRNDSPSQAAPPPPQWAASEDVADVTVAIAALVDNEGKVCIPQGVRKSRLLGFWDPEPGRRKCLVVRYTWGGREAVKAVMGREELRLP